MHVAYYMGLLKADTKGTGRKHQKMIRNGQHNDPFPHISIFKYTLYIYIFMSQILFLKSNE